MLNPAVGFLLAGQGYRSKEGCDFSEIFELTLRRVCKIKAFYVYWLGWLGIANSFEFGVIPILACLFCFRCGLHC